VKASGYERHATDWYVEPRWATDALLAKESFACETLDPACGQGNIVRSLRAHGVDAWGQDVVARYDQCEADGRDKPMFGAPADFLTDVPADALGNVANIVSNPPYGQATRFIENGLARARCKVAVLLRLAFLESEKRAVLFERTPLARVYVFANRLSMPPGELLQRGEIEAKGGSVAFAWFVWEHGHVGKPILDWARKPKEASGDSSS